MHDYETMEKKIECVDDETQNCSKVYSALSSKILATTFTHKSLRIRTYKKITNNFTMFFKKH